MRAMRRPRILRAACAALAIASAVGLATSGGSSAAPTKSQEVFARTLLDDAKTTAAIKGLLSGGGGFVAPEITFADLTGDERSDAIVLVDSGGVAGAVAVYVLSTDGEAADSPLRAVYRSQRLYHATVEVADGALKLRVPHFAAGDDVCCPANITQRTYAWSASAKTLRPRGAAIEFAGPSG